MSSLKTRILLVGSGGIGTIAALNLSLNPAKETHITAVLRSNYETVTKSGFRIKSLDYGDYEGWKPDEILSAVPDVSKASTDEGFDFIIVTTKNIPDVPPQIQDIVAPAVTPNRTVIVLIQNGLNIEKPFHKAFSKNVILSGVSLCGANEVSLGYVEQDDKDRLFIGAFFNDNLDTQVQIGSAKEFVRLYSASGKSVCEYDDNVLFVRWRKLLYNAVWNPISALTLMDTSRLRLAGAKDDTYSPVNVLIRPAMNEIRAAALAATGGKVVLPESLVDSMVECDPIDIFCKPSMQQDAEKGRYIEYENLLGEAIKEADRANSPMPTVKALYGLCRAVQFRTAEKNGKVDIHSVLKEYS